MRKFIYLTMVLIVTLSAGCASQTAFRMAACTAVGQSLTEVKVALDESNLSLQGRMALERENLWKAYQVDILNATKLPPEQVGPKLIELATKYQVLSKMIDSSGVETTKRFALAYEHVRFMQETMAQVYALEQDNLTVDAKLAQYRALATQAARQAFNIPSVDLPVVTNGQ